MRDLLSGIKTNPLHINIGQAMSFFMWTDSELDSKEILRVIDEFTVFNILTDSVLVDLYNL